MAKSPVFRGFLCSRIARNRPDRKGFLKGKLKAEECRILAKMPSRDPNRCHGDYEAAAREFRSGW
jgi:hypothetical protein